MPGQKRSRINRRTHQKVSNEQFVAIHAAAADRDNQLDALASEFLPQIRDMHDEYTRMRSEIRDAYEQARLSILNPVGQQAAAA